MPGSRGHASVDGGRDHNRTVLSGKGGDPPAALPGWTHWERRKGLPHLPRWRLVPAPPETSPQDALGVLLLALAADQVYDSVDSLAHALQAQPSRHGRAMTHHSSSWSPGSSGPPPAPVR